jgi:hypothetical protein
MINMETDKIIDETNPSLQVSVISRAVDLSARQSRLFIAEKKNYRHLVPPCERIVGSHVLDAEIFHVI